MKSGDSHSEETRAKMSAALKEAYAVGKRKPIDNTLATWAHDYEKCLNCGSIDKTGPGRHKAAGNCCRCHDRLVRYPQRQAKRKSVMAAKKALLPPKPVVEIFYIDPEDTRKIKSVAAKARCDAWAALGKWARDYDKCVICSTTEYKHHSNGICRMCRVKSVNFKK